jgi:hypothetical protein
MQGGRPRPGQRPDGGRYEIRITGHLEDRWADWFDGMTLDRRDDGTTVITGDVVDQSALHGLIQRVRDLGLPLVSVSRIDHDRPRSKGTRP